jgi:hypothetical protein
MIALAAYGILIILSLFWIFHLLVLLKIVPYTIVWGGRFTSDKQMYLFELLSLVIITLIIFIIFVHLGLLPVSFPKGTMSVILWIITALFALNTIGNILSKNKVEKKIFTLITFILMVFFFILALHN